MGDRSATRFALVIGCVITLYLSLAAFTRGDDSFDPARQHFDTKIAPLLAQRCLDCHSAAEKKGGLDLSRVETAMKGGESGPVLVPGKPAESYFWDRIAGDEMPPKKPLPPDEKALLEAWIAAGAKWGSDPIDPFRFTTGTRAGYDWWALQPVERPPVPSTSSIDSKNPTAVDDELRDWPRNSVDHFILAKLRENNLRPSPAADRRTLIRRLSFDLLGLPPTPEEVAAFVSDDSPDAYAKLVDRMLASSHYGERWARHWLDVVRFGESQGFERDKLRPNAWRYRDWIVRAFNSDMPYDEFARLQLAGDVFAPGNAAAVTATGFLVAGPYDEVGQTQQSAAMRAVVRQDELEDVVSTVGQTFLGLTVNCARCHDHKFDPVTQVEYYRLTAALGGVKHGERNIATAALETEADTRARALDARIAGLKQQLDIIEEPVRQQIRVERKTKQSEPASPPTPIARWEFNDDLKDGIGPLHGTAHERAKITDGRLTVDGRTGYVATEPITTDIAAKTLEAWVTLANLGQRGGGVVSLQSLDGGTFDAIVFGEQEPGRWMAGSNGFARTQSFQASEETEADKQLVHFAIVYSADGTIIAYRNGQPYGTPYKSSGLVTFKAGQAQVLFGLRHSPPGGNRFLAGAIDRAQLYDNALSPAEVAASAGVLSEHVSTDELLARLSADERSRRERLAFEIAQLESQRTRTKAMTTYAVTPAQPEVTHLLKRGNPAQPGDVVTPGGIAAFVGLQADFALAADAPDDQRRRRLAEWIAGPRNPLFPRVIVNRLWHYHFGIGLVDTPNDFGFNGGRPSHPQLLDWLAAELVRNNWSLKSVQRTLVLSAAYRQTSAYRDDTWNGFKIRSTSGHEEAAAAGIDAGNRLVWRREPMRLEAEAIRDAVLVVTNALNTMIGGPGYEDFTTFTSNSQFYVPLDPVGETFHRRSLYRTWVRSGRNRFLDVFDCPDPSTKTPNRAVTTTPLQALSLLNNSFILRMADRMAARLRSEAGDDTTRQIVRAYELAYGRSPDGEELEMAKSFTAQHGLAALCRVIFNSSEFVFVD